MADLPTASTPAKVLTPTPSLAPESFPRARQIVSINEEGTNFELDAKALEEIFDKVPEEMKVAIISVVGAFRTGKSFVLDLFLRYLRYGSTTRLVDVSKGVPTDSEDWKKWAYAGLEGEGDEAKLEGNSNQEQTHGEKGFSWRAGRKRNTTGIWMWETPFIRKSQTGEDIAVFLIDTQGMFDSETSQMLTASIFGLSTLLSSYQIYNVDKRVQEDNLQHLALFTEYGRMALFGSGDSSIATLNRQPSHLASSISSKSLLKASSSISTKSIGGDDDGTDKDDGSDEDDENDDATPRPFQRLDFLVRDWQDFSRKQSLQEKRADMKQYMKELLSSRKQSDLANTREQINSCFEHLQCFLLPHPGHEVTEREYDGSVSAIDNRFLELLTNYLDDLFDPKNLVAKKIHGMPLNSRELLTYIKTYAALFREATIFPEAKTLLEATAEANNVNMKDKALGMYKKEMEKVVGPKCKFVPINELAVHHELCLEGAVTVFDAGAKMGRKSQILGFRQRLVDEIEAEHTRYVEVNAERDPYKYLEFYLVPGVIGLALLLFRITQDLFCYEKIGYDIPLYDCKHVSTTLTNLYWAIFVFMILIAFTTGKVIFDVLKPFVIVLKAAVAGAIGGDDDKAKAKTE